MKILTLFYLSIIQIALSQLSHSYGTSSLLGDEGGEGAPSITIGSGSGYQPIDSENSISYKVRVTLDDANLPENRAYTIVQQTLFRMKPSGYFLSDPLHVTRDMHSNKINIYGSLFLPKISSWTNFEMMASRAGLQFYKYENRLKPTNEPVLYYNSSFQSVSTVTPFFPENRLKPTNKPVLYSNSSFQSVSTVTPFFPDSSRFSCNPTLSPIGCLCSENDDPTTCSCVLGFVAHPNITNTCIQAVSVPVEIRFDREFNDQLTDPYSALYENSKKGYTDMLSQLYRNRVGGFLGMVIAGFRKQSTIVDHEVLVTVEATYNDQITRDLNDALTDPEVRSRLKILSATVHRYQSFPSGSSTSSTGLPSNDDSAFQNPPGKTSGKGFAGSPAILAAIVSAIIAAIFCVVLCTICIVCRMKKKDSGSIELEDARYSNGAANDPRQMYLYNKPACREIYA